MPIKNVHIPPFLSPGEKRSLGKDPDRAGRFLENFKRASEKVPEGRPESVSSLKQDISAESAQLIARLHLLNMNSSLLQAMLGTSERESQNPGSLDLSDIMFKLFSSESAEIGEGLSDPVLIREPEAGRPRASVSRLSSRDIDAIIASAAVKNGLDPNLIRAVIKAESDFDPDTVSRAGAVGLMQLMPATAEELEVRDPLDPVQNIQGGCRYLRMMLERYQGDLDLALAAYNWGMGNLDRATGWMPRETRTYIDRVNRFYREFSGRDKA